MDAYVAGRTSTASSYLGWAWDATSPGGWTCGGGPSLIKSYDGTPTAYGRGLKGHLASLQVAGLLPPSLR